MREAVGGSLLFYIILGFIFVYIVFIAVIMNYAATYRASNYVLTRLEQTEGKVNIGSKSDSACKNTSDDTCSLYSTLKTMNYYNDLGVCCKQQNNGLVFKITTSVIFEVPLMGVDLPLYINNETKTIYGKNCSDLNYTICS